MPRTRWFAGIVVILAVVGCIFLYAHLLRKRAESLVRSAYELSNHNSDPLTSATLKKQYGSSLKTSQDCTPSFCAYEVVVTNRVLALLRLVPYTELKSQFFLRNGAVYENMLDYMTTVHRRYNVVAHASIGFNEDTYFAVDPWGASAPLDSNGLVHISAVLSNSKKQTVLALDTGCFTRIGGCTSIAELLPSVWQRTPNNQMKCVVSNHEGWVVAPADWWWVKGADQP